MPSYDKTGPLGLGVRTGRGLGPCGGGLRRSQGCWGGYGLGMRRFVSSKNELASLENEEKVLENELAIIREEKKSLKDQKK